MKKNNNEQLEFWIDLLKLFIIFSLNVISILIIIHFIYKYW